MIDENLIYEAQRMLHERWKYYNEQSKKAKTEEFKAMFAGKAGAYVSACDILLAAVQGNKEILREFDCYREGK